MLVLAFSDNLLVARHFFSIVFGSALFLSGSQVCRLYSPGSFIFIKMCAFFVVLAAFLTFAEADSLCVLSEVTHPLVKHGTVATRDCSLTKDSGSLGPI